MMPNTRRLRRELRDFTNKTEQPLKLYSGALGITIGGIQYVDVPTRPGFVYVRLRNNVSELIQAHNQQVSPAYDLPVLVVRTHNYYEIYSRDSQQYASHWVSSSSYLPRHGFQHEFDPDNGGGGDLVFVHGEQFYPLMGFPSGTEAANNILIAPYRYFYNGAWHYAGGTGTSDLLQYRPTGSSSSARLLLIGLDAATGNPFVKIGNEFSAAITGAAAMTSYVPTNISITSEIPGTIVRLVTGTSGITWANIYDARQYMGILQAASLTGTSFLSLSDTPDSYASQANKVVVVNSSETALEFRTNTGTSGGATTFLDLTDTPNSYSGQGSKFVAVNPGETALEFVTGSGGGVGTSDFVKLQKILVTDLDRHILFSNIPQGYSTLKFTGVLRSNGASNQDVLGVQFNLESGTYYSYNRAESHAALMTVTSVTGTKFADIFIYMSAAQAATGAFSSFEMNINNYFNSGTTKTAYGMIGGMGLLTSTTVGPTEGAFTVHYNKFENINGVRFFPDSVGTGFTSGSYITMYGIN